MGPLVNPFLDNEFMLRALVAGCLVALACAVVGTFVVLRGLAFIGDALAHGVLPGIAVAILLGYPGILGAAVGSAVMIGGIGYITRRSTPVHRHGDRAALRGDARPGRRHRLALDIFHRRPGAGPLRRGAGHLAAATSLSSS